MKPYPRCPHCRAYDPWYPEVRWVDTFDVTIVELTCGICYQVWRVPVPPVITVADTVPPGEVRQ